MAGMGRCRRVRRVSGASTTSCASSGDHTSAVIARSAGRQRLVPVTRRRRTQSILASPPDDVARGPAAFYVVEVEASHDRSLNTGDSPASTVLRNLLALSKGVCELFGSISEGVLNLLSQVEYAWAY